MIERRGGRPIDKALREAVERTRLVQERIRQVARQGPPEPPAGESGGPPGQPNR